ncbi:hypothetical protein TNCV_314001 [Trichonephila clavipes]|nr:hypothetical protein TNCV_314001 [Trichonephila clavipes]
MKKRQELPLKTRKENTFKLYTNSPEQKDQLIEFLEIVDFEFYAIRAKSERPIKVVITYLVTRKPTTSNELVMLGYTVDKVSQLTGRITKQKLPVFLITLPRNINNSKNFRPKQTLLPFR